MIADAGWSAHKKTRQSRRVFFVSGLASSNASKFTSWHADIPEPLAYIVVAMSFRLGSGSALQQKSNLNLVLLDLEDVLYVLRQQGHVAEFAADKFVGVDVPIDGQN